MAVVTASGADFEVVNYLQDRPDEATLRSIIARFEEPVEDLVRKDSQFDKLGLDAADYVGDADAVVGLLLKYPRLMQRPVLVRGDRAIIGRRRGDTTVKDRVTEFLA